jgi:hypothetical protein
LISAKQTAEVAPTAIKEYVIAPVIAASWAVSWRVRI